MKRRTVLVGGSAAALAATAAVMKPRDEGAPHDSYFGGLNALLRQAGPGHPVMVLDIDRVNHNIEMLKQSMGPAAANKTYRVVVKSLPSLPLLQHIMRRAQTNALMVFHQPFLNAIAQSLPESDVLLGKPMPINAVKRFYATLQNGAFDPAKQIQWLVDTQERLEQYLQFATGAGVRMRISLELDVGLHRGGFLSVAQSSKAIETILANPTAFEFAGFMGYEPHLTGVADSFEHPALQEVIGIYEAHLARALDHGIDRKTLTLNGAGSHTLPLYQKDRVLNDLSAGSALVMPSDFDTPQLADNQQAMFIAAPVLKHYPALKVPGDSWMAKALPLWNPNTAQLYFIYGGYWKANVVSPAGVLDWLYHSTNQNPMMASDAVNLTVDDHMFLRPTQSEHVMLQFGDLRIVQGGEIVGRWPVFSQTA